MFILRWGKGLDFYIFLLLNDCITIFYPFRHFDSYYIYRRKKKILRNFAKSDKENINTNHHELLYLHVFPWIIDAVAIPPSSKNH